MNRFDYQQPNRGETQALKFGDRLLPPSSGPLPMVGGQQVIPCLRKRYWREATFLRRVRLKNARKI
jgi:hypothetical protein